MGVRSPNGKGRGVRAAELGGGVKREVAEEGDDRGGGGGGREGVSLGVAEGSVSEERRHCRSVQRERERGVSQ